MGNNVRSMFQFEPVTDDNGKKFLEVWHDRAENDWQLNLIARAPDTIEMRKLIQSTLDMHPELDVWIEPTSWLERLENETSQKSRSV